MYSQFREDLDAYARHQSAQRLILALPFLTDVAGLVLYGQRVSVGHIRVFAGRSLRDLEVVYDKAIFYSAQSDRASLFLSPENRTSVECNFLVVDATDLSAQLYVLGRRVDGVRSIRTVPDLGGASGLGTFLRVRASNRVPVHVSALDPHFDLQVSTAVRGETGALLERLRELRARQERAYRVLVNAEVD